VAGQGQAYLNEYQLHYQQSANSTTANQANNNSFLTAGAGFPSMRNGCGIQPVTPDHKMQNGNWRPNGISG
jgi:hypothetical protein